MIKTYLLIGMVLLWLPQCVSASTRLGLFHTQEELNCWKQRAGVVTPGSLTPSCGTDGTAPATGAAARYRSNGDVSTNSPGDWDRIVTNRNSFTTSPTNGRWVAPEFGPFSTGGCVVAEPNGVGNTPDNYGWPEPGFPGTISWSMRLRDAAFWMLVTGNTADLTKIKTELFWVATQTFNNWAQPNPPGIWCFDAFIPRDTAPTFGITVILARILLAYDYVGRANFTTAELNQLDRWLFDAADFWHQQMDRGLNGVFANRPAGNYTRTEGCFSSVNAYFGGPVMTNYGEYYNNRKGSPAAFAAWAGVYLQQAGRNYTDGRSGGTQAGAGTLAHLLQYGKMFAQEFVRFGTFPQGVAADANRRGEGAPAEELGWAYGGVTIGQVASIVDAFGRTGDLSLLTYNTALGECGSEGTINDGGTRVGQNKDFLFTLQQFNKYPTDQYARYCDATVSSGTCTSNSPNNIDNRLDGRHPRNGTSWHGPYETYSFMPNLYYQDTLIKQSYTRTHPNSIAYPVNPDGAPNVWQGWQAVMPGTLFMFGQLEGVVNPYTLTGAAPSAPTNLRVVSP